MRGGQSSDARAGVVKLELSGQIGAGDDGNVTIAATAADVFLIDIFESRDCKF